jgi:hypothetical protein
MIWLYHSGHNLKECKSIYKRGTCIPMFISALYTIVNLWNQLRCPASDQWIKKMWYTCHVYLHYGVLVIKKNAVMSFAGKWIELQMIILSEIIQVQKAKHCMFLLICGI